MTDLRTSPRITWPVILGVAAACAIGGPAIADPLPSRDYPPTYSSHKAPWYDPFKIFTSSDQKPGVASHPITTTSPPALATNATPQPVITTPAWKWYGYGTPTPGQNPLAPNGSYPGVPGNWYTSSGATPGAVPPARLGASVPGVVPDPIPTPHRTFGSDHVAPVIPPSGPSLPDATTRTPIAPLADVSWQSSPARLRVPAGDSFASEDDRPRASLRAPVPVDDGVEAPTRSDAPTQLPPVRKPGEQSPSPDLPVEPAPDIVPPPMAGSVSMAITPVTARAVAPAIEIPPSVVAAVRRACGSDVRLMQIDRTGTKRVVVRLSGSPDAALAARDRLARDPDRAGWRVEFELVTPVGR